MNWTVTIAVIASGLATSGVAQSTCLTSGDLRTGIHVDYADGTSETYRTIDAATMSVEGFDGGEPYFRLELAQGTHLLSYVAIDGGRPDEASRQIYDYGIAAMDLPVPVAGGRFNADVVVTASDGARPEAQLQAYVDADPLTLGGCTYETLEVLIAYDTSDNYLESIRFLPQLGFGYLAWNQSDEGQSDENIVTAIRTGKCPLGCHARCALRPCANCGLRDAPGRTT